MYRIHVEDPLSDQRINNLNISAVEVKDNSEQNRGGKFISILCVNRSSQPFDETGAALILPSGKTLSIRKCEKSGENDYILSLKGLHRKDIKRGNIIVPASYAVESGKDAFILVPSGRDRLLKGNYFIEGGVFKEYNRRNNRPSASITFHGRVGVVRFFYPFPLVTGARYYISSENNRDLITPVTLIYPGALGQRESTQLSERILKFGGRPSLKALYSIILRIKQYVNLPVYLNEEVFDGSIRSGSFAIMSREYDRIKGALLKRTSTAGGVKIEPLTEMIKGEKALILQIVDELLKEETLAKRDGFLLNLSRDMRSSLSPIAGKLLADLEEGDNEINLSNISNPLFSETYRALGRMGLIRIMSDDIIISDSYFLKLKNDILSELSVGDELLFTEAKEQLQLSRRILIPLLEELDSEGYFEREGERRIVLKTV